MANVKGETGQTRDDVAHAGLDVDFPDRGNQIGRPLRHLLSSEDQFGCAGERIVAEAHTDGTSVPGRASERNERPRLTSYRLHNAHGRFDVLQVWALLDMHLNVGESLASTKRRCRHSARVAAKPR
jgi:hypothetical protein